MSHQGWALFIDGDMLVREDVAKLWALRDESKAVMCVHHTYKTKAKLKYLGSANLDYPRKNWSSVVLWNCGHIANRTITPKFIENATGAELHRFTWLEDNLIGEIPIEWNWLPDELGPNSDAKLLHFTLGAPCFHEYADTPMSSEWHLERMLMNYSDQYKDMEK
jgi:lipopolysaccharide biosynthesis glycosyltransferase